MAKRIIQRPVARVLIMDASGKWQAFRVYIDSGADISLFKRSDAELLGLTLAQGEYRPMVGIGKMLISAYVHAVKMQIGDSPLQVKAAFADSDETPRLLGRMDIFQHFKITFREKDLEIIFEAT